MKDLLRRQLIKKRKNTLHTEIFEKSELIENHLFLTDEFRNSKNILFYISYNNEVNTHSMIKKSMAIKKNIIVPISDKKNEELIITLLDKWEDLSIGNYNILEPNYNIEKLFPLDKIDLIIVPGIGFDIKGNRIGHGMGYYDKLLQKSNHSINIGLAFEFQIISHIQIQKHDIPLDKIITEKRIINCRK